MISSLFPLLKHAEKKSYALPAFNITDLVTAQAVVRAAVFCKSPLIMQTSEAAIGFAGHRTIVAIMEGVARDLGKNIPIVTHLDHGKRLALVSRSLSLGYRSVHMDASEQPYQTNCALTRAAVRIGRQYRRAVQGELGYLLGYEGMMRIKGRTKAALENIMTDPEQARDFVRVTGVDTLAVAVGTAHGYFAGKESIDFARLRQIRRLTGKPLVLHGGSGVADHDIRKAIGLGIRIINVDTVLRLRFMQGLRRSVSAYDARAKVDIRPHLRAAGLTMEREAIKLMKLFGSAGKAA